MRDIRTSVFDACRDIAGAATRGFSTPSVNRDGLPVDQMPGRPGRIARDMGATSHLLEAA